MKNIILDWLTIELQPLEALGNYNYIPHPFTDNCFYRTRFNSVAFCYASNEGVKELTIHPEIINLRPIKHINFFWQKVAPILTKRFKPALECTSLPETFPIHNVIIPLSEVDQADLADKALKSTFAGNQLEFIENGYYYTFTMHNSYAYAFAFSLESVSTIYNIDEAPILIKLLSSKLSKMLGQFKSNPDEQTLEPFSQYDNIVQLKSAV